MKNKKLKLIPDFKNEDEEREFWSNHDFTDYFDHYQEIELDLSQLKPTTESISLRIPSSMLMRIKQIANSRDVPYQSLMKIILAKQIQEELNAQRSTK